MWRVSSLRRLLHRINEHVYSFTQQAKTQHSAQQAKTQRDAQSKRVDVSKIAIGLHQRRLGIGVKGLCLLLVRRCDKCERRFVAHQGLREVSVEVQP